MYLKDGDVPSFSYTIFYTRLAYLYWFDKIKPAICLVFDDAHIYKAMTDKMASDPFIITSKPHKIIREGFPLDSLSIDCKTGKYFYDLEEGALDQVAVEEGFLEFFQTIRSIRMGE